MLRAVLLLSLTSWLIGGGCAPVVMEDPLNEPPAEIGDNAAPTDQDDTTDVSAGQPDPGPTSNDGTNDAGADGDGKASDGQGAGVIIDEGETGGDGPGDVGDEGDQPPPPPDNATAPLAGAYAGDVTRVRTESLGGPNDVTQNEVLPLTIEFEEDGAPLAILIPGHSDIPDFQAELRSVGDTVTFSGQFPSGEVSDRYSVTFTVTSAVYTGEEADLTIDIAFTSTSGALTRNGQGTHTLSARLVNDSLVYSATTNYAASWRVASLSFDVTEDFDDSGDLSRQ